MTDPINVQLEPEDVEPILGAQLIRIVALEKRVRTLEGELAAVQAENEALKSSQRQAKTTNLAEQGA